MLSGAMLQGVEEQVLKALHAARIPSIAMKRRTSELKGRYNHSYALVIHLLDVVEISEELVEMLLVSRYRSHVVRPITLLTVISRKLPVPLSSLEAPDIPYAAQIESFRRRSDNIIINIHSLWNSKSNVSNNPVEPYRSPMAPRSINS